MLRKTIAAALLLSAAAAHAKPEFYIGAGIGQSRMDANEFGIHLKGHDTSGQIFGGMLLNPNIALEVAYIDGGTLKDTIFGVDTSTDVQALEHSIRGIIPFSSMVRGFARAGILYWEAKATASDGFEVATAKSHGNDFSYGLGVEAGAGRGIGKLEWRHIDVEGTKWDLMSMGFSWKL